MFEFVDSEKYTHEFGIYEIRNMNTNCVYVGQTRQPFKKRFFYHRWQLRTKQHENPYLQASFNKHGEDAFRFSVRKVVKDIFELDESEIEEIEKARKEGKCYNILSGGGGRSGIPLPEYRRKELGELNRRLNTGKKASNETKQKMSEIRKGKPRDPDTIEKMVKTKSQFFLDGKEENVAKITAQDAAEIKKALMNKEKWENLAQRYGVSKSNINAIRSNRSWRYVYVEGWDKYLEDNKEAKRARQSRSAN